MSYILNKRLTNCYGIRKILQFIIIVKLQPVLNYNDSQGEDQNLKLLHVGRVLSVLEIAYQKTGTKPVLLSV